MKFGDKTQIFQPLQTAFDNKLSYYKYGLKMHTGILGVASIIVSLASIFGLVTGWVDFWTNDNLWLRLLSVIFLLASSLFNLIDFAHHYDERFTTVNEVPDVYLGVEPPSNQWQRLDMKDIRGNQDTVYINKQINIWLTGNEAIGLYRDRRSEKNLHQYISERGRWNNYFKPFLKYNYRKVMYSGGQFYNESKFGISKEFGPGDKEISVHKTCYFDFYLTNIIPGKQLVFNRNNVVVVDTEDLMPFQLLGDGQKKVLEPLGTKLRANELGVTTICITLSGYVFLWRQTKMAQSNAGLIVASGSGSSDWNDCKGFFGDSNGFRRAIILGMERELWEESCGDRRVSKNEFLQAVDTRILGYFRWLAKAGKSEFVGVSRLTNPNLEGCLTPEESEVKKGYNLDARNMKILQDEIKALLKKEKKRNKTLEAKGYEIGECSISCAMALLMLKKACRDYCKNYCQSECRSTSGKYQECDCTIRPYDALFDGILLVEPNP